MLDADDLPCWKKLIADLDLAAAEIHRSAVKEACGPARRLIYLGTYARLGVQALYSRVRPCAERRTLVQSGREA